VTTHPSGFADQAVLLEGTPGSYEVCRFRSCDDAPVSPEAVRSLVQDGFLSLNQLLGSREDMTDDEFSADWTDVDTIKFIASDHGVALGFLTVMVGLNRVNWVPRATIETYLHEVGQLGVPFYIGTLVVQPSAHHGVAHELLRGALQSFDEWNARSAEQSAAFFDCVGRNALTLPRTVQIIASTNPGSISVHQVAQLQEGEHERLIFAVHK